MNAPHPQARNLKPISHAAFIPCLTFYMSMDTRTPYAVGYPGEDGGKAAHYMPRWVATTGKKGPWSETASATIGE